MLIIEDVPDAATALQEALQLRGHVVEIAYTARAALRLLETFAPDAVLCDIGLPDLDGLSLAMRLRADPRYRDLYLIALTGHARDEDIARAEAAGFDRHLAKPPDLDQIEAALAAIPTTRPAQPSSHTLH